MTVRIGNFDVIVINKVPITLSAATLGVVRTSYDFSASFDWSALPKNQLDVILDDDNAPDQILDSQATHSLSFSASTSNNPLAKIFFNALVPILNGLMTIPSASSNSKITSAKSFILKQAATVSYFGKDVCILANIIKGYSVRRDSDNSLISLTLELEPPKNGIKSVEDNYPKVFAEIRKVTIQDIVIPDF